MNFGSESGSGGTGAKVTSSETFWKILLRRLISADVHYAAARLTEISGVTVWPFFTAEDGSPAGAVAAGYSRPLRRMRGDQT